jgi:hypothetical protein
VAPPSSALPQATRNIHTSDGTPSNSVSTLTNGGSSLNGIPEKYNERATTSPQPPIGGSVNGSLNSVVNAPPQLSGPEASCPKRERSESDAGVSNALLA